MDSEQSTIPNQKIDQVLQILGEMNNRLTNLETRVISVENRVISLESRVTSLESSTKQGFELLESRMLTVEIQLDNVDSSVERAISVSHDTLSVVKALKGEMRALRTESAYHGREIDRLENKINQAA